MGAISQYLGNAFLNAAFRNTAFSSPSQVFLSLHTAEPGDTGTGAEVSGGNYARQQVTFNAPHDVSGKQTIENSADISFPVASASWGTITHVGIWTLASGGSLLWYGALNASKAIADQDQFKVLASALVLDID